MCKLRSLICIIAFTLAACATEEPVRPARVVILADTHVIGPQYTTPHESNAVDNESILLAPDRLRVARDRIHAMVPLPDAVFVLGDVLHDAHHDHALEWYDANRNAFTVAKEIFDTFEMPVHLVMGNHDYEMSCDDPEYTREFSEELFRRFFGIEPYYAVTYGGVRLHMLNNQQGRTWDVNHEKCNTSLASYGEAQLRWLDRSLDDGKPSIVMSHYMGLLWDRNEVEDLTLQDLPTVLARHANMEMYLSGHTHRWLDLSKIFKHPHYVIGPSRYDEDNFWVLELGGPNGPVEIIDREKAIWSTTCAQTFSYDPGPMSIDDAVEMGTCVGLE
jgi:hypothetical protein